MKITIMRDQLVAALCTAGKADIRKNLNGVYLEATNLETRLSSTDGHVAALQRADAKGDNEVDSVVRMIIPRDAVERVKVSKTLPTVEINDEGGQWGLVDFLTRTPFTPLEGTFPDCHRVLPRSTSGEAAQFDPDLIAKFAKAAKVLGATYRSTALVAIGHNGRPRPGEILQTAALVTLGVLQDYVGVITPKNGDAPTTPPLWALSQLEAVSAPEVLAADDICDLV